MELELGLDPDDAARLTRLALLAPLKSGRARSRAVRIVWHDSPDRALAEEGLALAEQRPSWRLERLRPGISSWPPGAPAPVLATGRDRGRTRPSGARAAGAAGRVRGPRGEPGPCHRAGSGRDDPVERHNPGIHRRAPHQPGAARGHARGGGRRWRSRWPANFAWRCRAPAWRPRLSPPPPARRHHRGGRARPNCPRGCLWPRRSPM